MNPSFLALLVLAVALPAAAGDGDPANPAAAANPANPQASAFALMKARMMQKNDIPLSAAGVTLPPAVVTPPPPDTGHGTPPPPDWHRDEAERQAEFDRQFGAGAWKNITDFSSRCEPPACNFLATAGILRGGYDFVDLRRDVEAKRVEEGSPAFAQRDGAIKVGMRQTLEQMRPTPEGDPKQQEELIRVSDPIVKKVFTPQELVRYAQTNAAAAQTAPYYAFLGRTLNANAQPGPARAAFDAALARDPAYQPALSGRAESAYRLGDYPSAVKDARAALALRPDDAYALSTLKFSEGRSGPAPDAGAPGGAAPGTSGGAAAFAAASAASAAPGGGRGLAPASVPGDALHQSEAFTRDAKRALTLGDLRGAAEAARRAIAMNPANAAAYSLAAVANIRLKDYAAALAAAESGLKVAPNSAALHDFKAFALNGLKDRRGALAAADRALELKRNDPVAYFNRAVALYGLGDRDGSLTALKSAAALDPKFLPALNEALRLPTDADLLYLFPGDAPAPEAAPESAAGARPAWLLLGGGVLVGLLIAGLALALTRRPAPSRAAPPPLATPRWVPQRLAGKFEVGRELGSGGMGVVYEGFDSSLGRPVAIKRLREELRRDPKEAARFLSEAKLVARLKHPNIVEVYAVVDEGGELFLVFERVTGRTLHDLLSREKRLPFQRARDLFRGVCAALDEAHKRAVIHRDLKPANIMIEATGRARVMDFGIARLAEDAVSRVTRTVVGTPLYMAPEQEQGVSRRESDLFAAGVCFYETLTGSRPFDGAGPGLLIDKLHRAYEPASKRLERAPAGLDDFFARALEPDPEKRFPTATEFLRGLESLDAA
ncbi:MAG: protein kinase [Elusimicrobia bacterium]|nr:protein kinase [Elusimicrobiota bacterium]